MADFQAAVNEVHEGFRVKRVVEIPSLNSVFYELLHEDTGARYVHLQNDDPENTFSVVLKTVPQDSTGVAHILEHTVLCGSGRFPVRDPFFSMIKRSLSTFMNAFTASDWTMYPFSTQNEKDFYNLMDVYLDAVFFPNLFELSFKQEGHRIETAGEGEEGAPPPLVYKGVVYNEMKGAMSSPDQVLVRSLMNALYPGTTYRNNSGGDPSEIPSLTHRQLVSFHQRHYHPSNAFFYTYGNLPLKKHLAFLNERLFGGGRFTRIDPRTDVPNQPRWNAPKQVEYPYPLGRSENPEKKYQVCVSWLLADVADVFEVLALALLEEILIGNPAAPLRKALIESGIGSALADGSGFSPDMKDTMFSCGLKDVSGDDAQRIEELVLGVLKDLHENGIDPELVESAIHQIEFHRKEVTNTPYPYGLRLLLSFSGGWIHGADPLGFIDFDQDLERIKEGCRKGRFFEEQILKYFIENSHRALFTLRPDPEMAGREAEKEQAALKAAARNLTPADLEKIEEDARKLAALQETEEDVSVLPTLSLSDVPPDVTVVARSQLAGHPGFYAYEQPTRGIFYYTMLFGLGRLDEKLLRLLPLFCYCFDKAGTSRSDYTSMIRKVNRYTGGVGASVQARNRYNGADGSLPFVSIHGKCLARNQQPLFDILSELVHSAGFRDLGRLKSIVQEYRAGAESRIVQNGHQLAMSLAARNFSELSALKEMWHGVHQVKTIKELAGDLSSDRLEALAADLNRMAALLFENGDIEVAMVGENDTLASGADMAANLAHGMKTGAASGFRAPSFSRDSGPVREGWAYESAVSFVAKSFQAVKMVHEDAPALAVISKILRSLYLHREIREKGGAYGGFALYDMESGVFSFGSYRDPHIANTLDVYNNAVDFIVSGSYTPDDVKEAVLQVCSNIDKPDGPGATAKKAFYRQLTGLSDETRRSFKKSLLEMDIEKVRLRAGAYFKKDARGDSVAVISGQSALESENRKLGDRPLDLKKI